MRGIRHLPIQRTFVSGISNAKIGPLKCWREHKICHPILKAPIHFHRGFVFRFLFICLSFRFVTVLPLTLIDSLMNLPHSNLHSVGMNIFDCSRDHFKVNAHFHLLKLLEIICTFLMLFGGFFLFVFFFRYFCGPCPLKQVHTF